MAQGESTLASDGQEGRKGIRASSSLGWQAKRRVQALQKQQSSRHTVLELRRFARAVEASEEPPPQTEAMDTPEDLPSNHSRPRSYKQQYSNRLMMPEWMTEPPTDLHGNWYVSARPEGQRCLVIAAGGTTTSRLRNASLLQSFQSALPQGSTTLQSAAQGPTVLDCIFQDSIHTYWVLDIISWNGYVLAECNAECRITFWVQSKLGELQALPEWMKFVPLPFTSCSADALLAAHSGPVPFVRDGCYFLHKQGLYETGTTPLALVWKDAHCSRYILDTDAEGVVPELQQLTLTWRMDGTVATEDEPPVVLARMPSTFSAGRKLRPGLLLRFALGPGGIQFDGSVPTGADLRFVGPANQRRGRADAFSKILFQHRARTDALQLEHLMRVMQSDVSMASS